LALPSGAIQFVLPNGRPAPFVCTLNELRKEWGNV
jgi:hypothetical protein